MQHNTYYKNKQRGVSLGEKVPSVQKTHPIPSKVPFIQVLNVAECHWVVVSNVNHRDGGCVTASVGYYYSGRPFTISVIMRDYMLIL